ncbi:MAG: hypothetical protein ACP5U2_18240, partial [Bryobacteraceae bacterium]
MVICIGLAALGQQSCAWNAAGSTRLRPAGVASRALAEVPTGGGLIAYPETRLGDNLLANAGFEEIGA